VFVYKCHVCTVFLKKSTVQKKQCGKVAPPGG
jgi:hypothetical protein